jgi:Tol biopolymer transport system component
VYGKNGDEAEEFGFYAVVVDEIYTDSCAAEDETARAVGPGIADLYAALREQTGGSAVSEPVSTTLGGYPATRIDLKIPKHLDLARCRMAPAGLQIWYSEPADKHFVLLDDATASVYVVDVGGRRQVFLTQVGNSTSAADRAELQTVLDSIRIEGSSSTPELSLTSTAPPADGSIYFAADARGGDALTDPVSFVQAELHAKPSDIYLSRRGDPVRRVVATDGTDRCPRVSPDGGRLAYLHDSTIVVAPLDAAGQPSIPQVRAHLPATPSECPQWSPDGRSVGYVVFVGDAPLYTARPAEVHAVTLDGDDRVVASFEAQTWHQPAFAWSPDGGEVAYTTESGIWLAPLRGVPELLWRPAAGDPSQELPMVYDRPTSLAWSRRGEIAFTVYASEPAEPNDPYGTGAESWAVRVIDPESRRVDRLGAMVDNGEAAWSPDGGRLAFVGPDGQVRVHDRVTGSKHDETPRHRRRGGFGEVAWAPDGNHLLTVTRSGPRGYALVSIPIDGSEIELRTPWNWALDWIGLDDVDWSSR